MFINDGILVLPQSIVNEVLEGCHDHNGHQGIDRTLSRVNIMYTWRGKHVDVRRYVRECKMCIHTIVSVREW